MKWQRTQLLHALQRQVVLGFKPTQHLRSAEHPVPTSKTEKTVWLCFCVVKWNSRATNESRREWEREVLLLQKSQGKTDLDGVRVTSGGGLKMHFSFIGCSITVIQHDFNNKSTNSLPCANKNTHHYISSHIQLILKQSDVQRNTGFTLSPFNSLLVHFRKSHSSRNHP